MTTDETRNPNDADHQATWEQLPWYVNGTLEAEELDQVERHVADCVACRAELDSLHELARLIHDSREPQGSPEASLKDVLARIEKAQRDEAGRAEEPRPGRRGRVRPGPWRRTPRWMRAALLGQAAAILLLVSLFALPPERRTRGDYRTHSADAPVATDARTRINLVFEPDTTEARLRELVSSIGGEIIAGPTARGVYTVAAPVGESGDPSQERLLELLRAQPEIGFAELAAAARKGGRRR